VRAAGWLDVPGQRDHRWLVRLRIAIAIACASCGRIDFDPLDDAAPGFGGSDGAPMGGTNIVLRQASSGLIASPGMSVSASLNGGINAGDLLVVGVSLDGPVPSLAMLADTMGNSFTTISSGVAAPFVVYLSYGFASASGSETVDETIDTTPNTGMQIQLWDFGGIAPNGFVDCAQADGQSLATDGATTRALDVSAANELVFGWGVFFTTGTTGTGFASLSDFNGDPAEFQIAKAPGSIPVTMTMAAGGTNWTIVGATFRGD
jgi:hypothetical protein